MALVVSQNIGAVGRVFAILESGCSEEAEGATVVVMTLVEQAFAF
jgi:hypothetical protein